MMRSLILATTVFLSAIATAQPALTRGDVVVSGIPHSGLPEDPSVQPFRVLDASLHVKYAAEARSALRFVLDSSLRITDLTGQRYNGSFQMVSALPLHENVPVSVAVANDGRTFILGGGGWLSIFAADGTPSQIAPWDLGSTGTNIDLAPDQCTLVFTGASKRVRRYDVCRSAFAADFAIAVPGGYVRALSDGGVAVLHDADLSFYDVTGRMTYSLPLHVGGGWFTFDATAGQIWINNGRFRLSDGKLNDFIEAPFSPQSFAVVDALIPSSTSMLTRRRAAR